MVKGIERYGIPVVHMATVVPISLTIGANRIIPGVGIPYPLGDPTQGEADSKKIREKIEYDTSNPQYIETIWGVGYRFKI